MRILRLYESYDENLDTYLECSEELVAPSINGSPSVVTEVSRYSMEGAPVYPHMFKQMSGFAYRHQSGEIHMIAEEAGV